MKYILKYVTRYLPMVVHGCCCFDAFDVPGVEVRFCSFLGSSGTFLIYDSTLFFVCSTFIYFIIILFYHKNSDI